MARGVTTPIQVREARADEHDAVGRLTVAVYRAGGWGDDAYLPVLRDVAGRVAQATVLVAVRDDRLLGTVTVATRGGPYAEHAGAAEAVVRMLVVDPATRGQGVGELLVRECLDRARAAGRTLVRLSTQPDMTAAHRLYERLGFVRAPEGDWRPAPDVQLLAYALRLEPA